MTEEFMKWKVAEFPRNVIAGHNVLKSVKEMCDELKIGRTATIISGEITMKAAGKEVMSYLDGYDLDTCFIGDATLENVKTAENQIKEFVKTHPHCTVREIVRETKVPLRYASKMIRTGQFVAGGKISYPCSRCGKAITSGLYCSECMALVQKAAITAKKLEAERKAKEEQERIKKKLAEKKGSGLNILKILRGK